MATPYCYRLERGNSEVTVPKTRNHLHTRVDSEPSLTYERVQYASHPYSSTSVTISSPVSSPASLSRLVTNAGGEGSCDAFLSDEGVFAPLYLYQLYTEASRMRQRRPAEGRYHYLLAYVAPSTTRQFVSLSCAQAHLLSEARKPSHVLSTSTSSTPEHLAGVYSSMLRGGHWCFAYRVQASQLTAVCANPATEAATVPSPPQIWCFTLEPLPTEQQLLCSAALGGHIRTSSVPEEVDGTLPRQSTLTSSTAMVSKSSTANKILATPLYVCGNPAAVVPLNTSARLHLLGNTANRGEPGYVAGAAQSVAAELDTLLLESPACGTLVYALLLRQRLSGHRCVASPLSLLFSDILDSAEEENFMRCGERLAADVYVSVVPPMDCRVVYFSPVAAKLTPSSFTPREGEEGEDARPYPAVTSTVAGRTASLSQELLRRWARLSSQYVLSCGEPQAALLNRRELLLHHAHDIQGGASTALSTQNDPYTRKVCAARYLLDALRPAYTGQGRLICDGGNTESSVVADAVDLVLEECGVNKNDRQAPMMNHCYRFSRGHVRRVTAFAPVVAPPVTADASVLAPEPDYLEFPWCTAHATALNFSDRQGRTSPTSPLPHAASEFTATHSHFTLPELDRAMEILHFTSEQQACLHDVSYGLVYLASLKFISRKGSSVGPAEVSPRSQSALSAASKLLHLSDGELVFALTTVETRGNDQRGSPASRHPANCTGAVQMQRVLVTHLGGVLVRTLIDLINTSLHVDRCVRKEVRSLTLAVTANSESTPTRREHVHPGEKSDKSQRGRGGGLTAWYTAYLRCYASEAVRDRLVGVVQRESRYEGVEGKVVSWLDHIFTSPVPLTRALQLDTASAEVRQVAARVRVPAAPQGRRGLMDSTRKTLGADDLTCTSRSVFVMSEVARILEAVMSKCIPTDASAAPMLPSLAAVQCLLLEQLQGLVASFSRATAAEGGDSAAQEGEVELAWESAASVESTMRDGILVLTFPCGFHSPLRLSVNRLAADIFAAARLWVMARTHAIQKILCSVAKRCLSLISTDMSPVYSEAIGSLTEMSPQTNVGGHCADEVVAVSDGLSEALCSAHRALTTIFSFRRNQESSGIIPSTKVGYRHGHATAFSSDFLYVLLAIPIPEKGSTLGAVADVRHVEPGQLGPWKACPFLEPMPCTSLPSSSSSSSTAPVTRDDVLTAYFAVHNPFLLALFFWSRLCHCHMVPVPVFATAFAVPLLTFYAQCCMPPGSLSDTRANEDPAAVMGEGGVPCNRDLRLTPKSLLGAGVSPTPRLRMRAMVPGEAATALMSEVRHLQCHACYHKLCTLVLEKVPWCGDGGAVLGASVIFLGAATLAAIRSSCVELRVTAVRCLQEVGRGFLARRRLRLEPWQLLSSHQRSLHSRGKCLASNATLTLPETRERETLERERDTQLLQTARERTTALTTSTRHLSQTVVRLQQGWEETLELLEGELVGAVNEMNAFETQRRAAESAAREDALLELRIRREAWREVHADFKKHVVYGSESLEERQGGQVSSLARRGIKSITVTEEALQQAAIAARRISQLRHEAVHATEAALLSQLIKANRREDLCSLASHIQRQEARVTQMADNRLRDLNTYDAFAHEEQRCGGGCERGTSATAALHTRLLTTVSGIRQCTAEGFSCTPPRSEPSRGNTDIRPTRCFVGGNVVTPPPPRRGRRSARVGGHTSFASIEHSSMAATVDSSEWAVQRDLLSLWESSSASL